MIRFVCGIADAMMRFNRHPFMVLVFPFICGVVILLGWYVQQIQLTLLALTSFLSIDASWTNRLTMLKQGQEAGEVPRHE